MESYTSEYCPGQTLNGCQNCDDDQLGPWCYDDCESLHYCDSGEPRPARAPSLKLFCSACSLPNFPQAARSLAMSMTAISGSMLVTHALSLSQSMVVTARDVIAPLKVVMS